jgi:hypothetical protein
VRRGGGGGGEERYGVGVMGTSDCAVCSELDWMEFLGPRIELIFGFRWIEGKHASASTRQQQLRLKSRRVRRALEKGLSFNNSDMFQQSTLGIVWARGTMAHGGASLGENT